ncbi:MAG: ATP-dependent sacrificial sulfur transferase LarE [Lachnospiraceae bacterium]|nr:ATP-dependent sacrificial sulfur transferase LarE [Lachnospiraceae bacterium]
MNLEQFFTEYPKVALGFSGGVDSAYLLYAASKYAKEVRAYYVKSAFQPAFELEDAKKLADEIGADLKVIHVDVLKDEQVAANPPDRCYYCKRQIFGTISSVAKEDGYTVLLDGTNASDDADDRPGMKALGELRVLSPLRLCGLTKQEIRERSKEAGLFTWNKPSYACLATRVATGEKITAEKLEIIEQAEDYLFSLGFSDFRVRTLQGHARLEIPKEQTELLLQHREEILQELKESFLSVSLDLNPR